jgi:hypothetical protein
MNNLELEMEMMQSLGLDIEFKIVDVSFQIPVFTKRTRGEQVPFKPQAGGGIFGGAEQNQ